MLTTQSDEDLIQLVQDGNLPVFEQLVQRYRPALLRVVYSKLRDRSHAEDVVQESLLAAFAARHTYNPDYAFRTWIWTITLRLCHQHVRRRCGVPAGTVNCDPVHLEQASSADCSALSALLQSERAELLLQALDELSEVQADALRLRFFGGLTYEDVAAAMTCSVRGAKQRVKSGLERLALRLKTLSGVEQ